MTASDDDARAGAPATAVAVDVAAARKPVVLVVDDDEFQLKIIELFLGPQTYELHCMSSAALALVWLRNRRADLVMVDVQMPDMDGLDLTRRIKASPMLSQIPVLLMSGQGENTMLVHCLDAGAQDFVVKPFERVGLQAKIAQLLTLHALPSVGAAPSPHPGINVKRGLGVWGRKEDYTLFLRKFALTYADCAQRLHSYYAQQDGTAARSLAHKLRGAAGTMALDDVARCAGALEMLDPDHDPQPSLARLQQALEVVLASIATYAGGQGGPAG